MNLAKSHKHLVSRNGIDNVLFLSGNLCLKLKAFEINHLEI